MRCSNCGTENRPGRKFCSQCGSTLSVACPACGHPNEPADRYCGNCGNPLPGEPVGGSGAAAGTPPPEAERRLVTVLFADLVGFTSLSEGRDSEEVRDLLSRYFDSARRVVDRYAGTVEKFIGDAVMAVWGTPVAREDDAERAVRAALDLVDAVVALGSEVGAPGLRARAGVLTGEAAVTLGATDQGMVAGDIVNTASRIQSVAPPGAVLVGEDTRRATKEAIAYEDAGSHELRGKSEPITLWRAVRAVAGRGGALRAAGLEAPFVGRDTEFRVLKELFHASVEQRRPHLVTVVGQAGIGKSRLSQELEKYVDGLASTTAWHRGRCLAYGDGVAYWALAEMVRMRAGIVEGEQADPARAKLSAALDIYVTDPEERPWMEPRVAHLVGLEEQAGFDREELFAAWRLFFERVADRYPTVMVFEDMQWADAALLDFIEHLMDRFLQGPLFVLALARPELAERRSGWGVGKRNFTSTYLQPLLARAMRDLLDGLAPGLPEELTEKVLDRAEGVPLYAVETVRMLLDRGLLRKEAGAFQPTGPIEDLEVPQTLLALIAARLDGLGVEERRLLQDASVLGKSFTREGLATVTGLGADRLEELLGDLARRELILLQSDPRSPERGQYAFVQDVVKRVAYETISKRDRKAKHVAVAKHLESAMVSGEDELVEVIASHYVEAYRLAPDAEDGPALRRAAADTLTRAGTRAASLAANADAKRYFERAAELTSEPAERAGLLERAADMAWARAGGREAEPLFEEAIRLFESERLPHPAARVEARLAEVLWDTNRIDQAVTRMERAFDVLSKDPPDADLAMLAAQVGRFRVFTGGMARASEPLELALEIAERLWLPEVISQAMDTKALLLDGNGRPEESLALMLHALRVALDNDMLNAAFRAYFNLHHLMILRDRYAEALEFEEQALALARRRGYRQWELMFLGASGASLYMTGRWDEAIERLVACYTSGDDPPLIALSRTLPPYLRMRMARGEVEEARAHLSAVEVALRSGGTYELTDREVGRAILFSAAGDPEAALEAGLEALFDIERVGFGHENIREVVSESAEAAITLGRLDQAEAIIASIEGRPGFLYQFERAQMERLRALLEQARGDPARVPARLKSAAGMFREIGAPFWLAVTLLDHAEWLASRGEPDPAAPLADEAAEIFERLGARPWVERAARIHPRPVPAGSAKPPG